MDKRETKEEVENLNEETGQPGQSPDSAAQEKTTAAADVDDEALVKLREELDGAKDKYIRLYSEFENFRKRTAKEKLELIQSANEQLIKSMLPVADDFERAENSFPDKNAKELA